jgi:hypothetical protein
MRTTLTLDEDVAAALGRVRKRSGARRTRQIVNEALRRGLAQMAAPAPQGKPYRTPSTSLGRCLLRSLDNIADVLAETEGHDSR